jgi:hypothetical protein
LRRGEHALGSTIDVLFLPERPKAGMKVDGFINKWAFTLISGLLAVWLALWWRRQQLINRFKAGVYGEPPFPINGGKAGTN